jgi:hypothetical protein
MNFLKQIIKRTSNQLRGCLKDKIIFIHIPKCAGGSIGSAIRECFLDLNIRNDRSLVGINAVGSSNVIKMINQTNYPYSTNDDYPILRFRENLLLYYMSKESMRYISGHFTYSEIAYQQFLNKFAFVTVLRDPVKRWISSYFYNKYKEGNHRKINEDIKEYLESHFSKSQGYEYVKFIGGAHKDGDYTSKEAIEKAKKNLHKFKIIGSLEYLDNFNEKFFNSFGFKLKIGKRNRNPKEKFFQESILNDEIKEVVKNICKPDLEVYQYALNNIIKITN